MKVRIFSLTRYLDNALRRAEYTSDADGCVVARVAGAAGFFSQGASFEEARENLRDAIEGNVLLALQLELPIPMHQGRDVGVGLIRAIIQEIGIDRDEWMRL